MQQVVVANTLEANTLDHMTDAERASWIADDRHFSGKSLYWPETGSATFVSYWPLDELAALATGFALPGQQRTFIAVPRRSLALCDDLLADAPSFERLLAGLDPAEPIELLAWVSSRGLARLAERLRARGFTVRPTPEAIERAAEVERSLRARQAMVDMLGSLPEVEPLRPATTPFETWDDIRAHLAARGLERGWVIKGRDSVGGSGVLMIDTERELRRVIAAPAPSRPPEEAGFYLRMDGPFVVEELIGDRATNLSPTMDLHVAPDAVGVIAVGWQVLQRDAGYVGILTGARVAVPPPAVLRASLAIGRALADRGYGGFANLDYIVTREGRWSVMEVNLRRSSPIDHFQSVARLGAQVGGDGVMVSLDYVRPACAERLAEAAAARGSGVRVDRRLGDLVTGQHWVGLFLGADSAEALEGVLDAASYDGDDNLRELTALARRHLAARIA